MTVDTSLTPVSRDVLLERGGSFTVHELQQLTLGEIEPVTGGRFHLLTNRDTQVRLIPQELYLVGNVHVEKGHCLKALGIIKNGFDYYMQCTARGFMAPLIPNSGEWEWPKPEDFNWSELDSHLGFIENLTKGKPQKLFEPRHNLGETIKFKIARTGDVRFAMSDELQNLALSIFARDLTLLLEEAKQGRCDISEVRTLLQIIKEPVGMTLFALT